MHMYNAFATKRLILQGPHFSTSLCQNLSRLRSCNKKTKFTFENKADEKRHHQHNVNRKHAGDDASGTGMVRDPQGGTSMMTGQINDIGGSDGWGDQWTFLYSSGS